MSSGQGEWGWVRRVDDHITLGKGIDDIAIAPEKTQIPRITHPHRLHGHTDKKTFYSTSFIHFLLKETVIRDRL